MKDDLYEKGIVDEFLTQNDLKLISYVEEIQDILNEEELDFFNMFKERESYKADSKSYEDNYIEFENVNYQKYFQMINMQQYVTKKVYTEIALEKDMTWNEKHELLNVLIDNTIKQTNCKFVYNNIVDDTEFTEDEKTELLQIVFAWIFTSLEKDLSERVEDKMNEYGYVLISYSEKKLNLEGIYNFERCRFLGYILLGHYVKNRESFMDNLDTLFENLYIKYFLKSGELTVLCWECICEGFIVINKLHDIYSFVERYINRILDEHEEFKFSFLQLLNQLTKQVYKETNDEKYRELSNNYKSKMNQLLGINYEIKN